MCMVDGGERSEVWLEWRRRAHKKHQCSECGRSILRGETYRRTKDLYDGRWSSTAQCAHCMVLADWLSEECGGYLTHGIVEDFGEHAEEYCRFDLRRLQWGALHKWNRKGNLMPIPKLPLTSEQITGLRAG